MLVNDAVWSVEHAECDSFCRKVDAACQALERQASQMLWRGRSASSGVDVWSMFVNLVLNVLVLKFSVPCSTYRVPGPLFFDSDDT